MITSVYYGPELLVELKDYYAPRLKLAIERGYAETGSQYHWLYEEVHCRLLTLDQTIRFIDALPKFMAVSSEEQIFQYVMNFATSLFKRDGIGEIQRNDLDQHPYFNDMNPYWVQMNETLDSMGTDYDTKLLPLLYIDLTEYIVRSVRLYFQIREKSISAVDRGKFDQLMKLSVIHASSA